MSSLSAKDRVSLCSFTFADGRRCRTPRTGKNPHFCPYHAEKEARARTTQKLGKDLDYFFSGDYLSACDLSTALARLIPAVLRGDVKPRAARTVAYLMQILLQSIHISQNEFINAFGTDNWRDSIRKSVKGNYNYRFPPAPKPEQPALAPPSPQAPNVVAGLQTGAGRAPQTAPAPQPDPPSVMNCHSERSEEPAFSSSSSAPPSNRPQPAAPPTESSQSEIPTLSGPAPSPHTPLPPTSAEFVQRVLAGPTSGARAPQACHPERSAPSALRTSLRSEGSHPIPATPPPACPDQDRRDNPPQPPPSTSPREPNRDAPWLDFSRSIRPDSHLL